MAIQQRLLTLRMMIRPLGQPDSAEIAPGSRRAMPRWMTGILNRLLMMIAGDPAGPLLAARQTDSVQAGWVRVAALSAPLTAKQRDDAQAVLTGYEPLVIQAAARGARLIVLPARLAALDERSYPAWIARVRHWARQSQAWIVLGYSFGGADSDGRLLAIDPTGSLVSGRDAHAARPEAVGPAALFSHRLTLEGWCLSPLQGRGLLALPTVSRRSARLATLIGQMAGAALVCAGQDDVWIVAGRGRRESGVLTEAGARMLVLDLRLEEGRVSSPSNPTP